MRRISFVAGIAVLLFAFCVGPLTVEAGPWRHPHHHHHYHHRGDGTTAAVAFAVGAVATVLTPPPPPPPVVIHERAPRPYYYGPPVVQREIIYQDRPVYVPTPSIQQPAPAPTPVQQKPTPVSGPSFTPRKANSSTPVPGPAVGTVVDRLPPSAGSVQRNGVTYFVADDQTHYLPIRVGNESKYVVVQP